VSGGSRKALERRGRGSAVSRRQRGLPRRPKNVNLALNATPIPATSRWRTWGRWRKAARAGPIAEHGNATITNARRPPCHFWEIVSCCHPKLT
jgi:hypothetical protein